MWKLLVCGVIKMQTLTFLSALFLIKFNMKNKIVQCSFTFSHWPFSFAFVEKMCRFFFLTFHSIHFLLMCWTVPPSGPKSSTNCDSLTRAQNDGIEINFPGLLPLHGPRFMGSSWGTCLLMLTPTPPPTTPQYLGKSRILPSVYPPWSTGFAMSP